eukprot:gene12782-14997_t
MGSTAQCINAVINILLIVYQTISICSKKQENKKQPTLRKFLITINTNQKDEKYVPLLRNAYQHFYDNIQDYLKFVGGIDKRTAMKQVHSYEGDCGIEIGGKQKRVHLHSLVIFEHNTKLQLDQTKIRSYFCDALELKSIHLDIKYIRDEIRSKSLKWIDESEHYDTDTDPYDSESDEDEETSKRSRSDIAIKRKESISLTTLQEGLQLHLPSLTIIAEFNQVYVLCPTADLQDQYAFLDKKDNATTLYITHLKEHSVKTAYELGRGFSNEREFKVYLDLSCRDYQVVRINLTAKNKDPHITFKSIICPCFTIQ